MGGEIMKHMLDYYEVKDAPQKEIDKTIKALPQIIKKPSIFTGMKIQVLITPKYYYALLLLLTISIFKILLSNSQIYFSNSIDSYYRIIIFYLIIVILITIPEIDRSHMYKMEEIERSCRFHYVHLLFQRLTLIAILLFAISLIITIVCANMYSIPFLSITGIIFTPLIFIIQLTLFTLRILKIRNTIYTILVFTFISMISMIFIVPWVIINHTLINLVLILILGLITFNNIKKILKEVKENETFSIESE